jgi:uncharacterized Zn finger protein
LEKETFRRQTAELPDSWKEQMSDLPQLTESHIRAWTDPGSFGRGQGYYRAGHIVAPRRQDRTLKARCIGSRPGPYYVEVTLGPLSIASGDGSCPVGAGGHCKHAVALLLTWLHKPDTFTTAEDVETALKRRSRAELIVIIRRMLDRYPELERVLDLPIVTAAEDAPPVDADFIRHQAGNAFGRVGYDDWVAAYDVAQRLLELVRIGDDYAEIERWDDAATIYRSVMEETLDGYGMVDDEGGYLHDLVHQCIVGLEACLSAIEDRSRREVLLEALLDVIRWDVDFGGIDMGYQAPDVILDQATPEEKRKVAQWVRGALSGGSSWGRERYGRFLLQLEEAWLDDEAYLLICRQTGRREDLVERLLALGRVDEAAVAAREAHSYVLIRLADHFVARGHGELAEALIRERMTGDADGRLIQWLKEWALERGDRVEALVLTEKLFWHRPGLEGYGELRALAWPMERWHDLRAAILSRLAEEERDTLLIEIYLKEGEVDRALETLEETREASRWRWRSDRLRVDVAQAVEAERPREAIRLYGEAVNELIAARGRHNYATAAAYLTRVRDLYRRLDEASTWETYITQLHDRNPRLRALKDELNKAGLIS